MDLRIGINLGDVMADGGARERQAEDTDMAANGPFKFPHPLKHLAKHRGFYFILLPAINPVASPGYPRSFWVALGSLIWLGRKAVGSFDPGTQGPPVEQLKISGDHTLS